MVQVGFCATPGNGDVDTRTGQYLCHLAAVRNRVWTLASVVSARGQSEDAHPRRLGLATRGVNDTPSPLPPTPFGTIVACRPKVHSMAMSLYPYMYVHCNVTMPLRANQGFLGSCRKL